MRIINIINFLERNKQAVDLLKNNQLCLIGVEKIEVEAIVYAFEEDITPFTAFWN